MTITTLPKIRQYLGDVADQYSDTQLMSWQEDIEPWIERIFGVDWSLTPGQAYTTPFHNVMDDGVLWLPDWQPSILAVTVVAPSGWEHVSDLFNPARTWDDLGEGKVQLQPIRYVTVAGLPNAWSRRLPQMFREVDVSYIASAVVPPPIAAGVALIIAANLSQAPQDVAGVRSESIGGYSYSLPFSRTGSEVGSVIPERARRMLQPYLRNQGARVV